MERYIAYSGRAICGQQLNIPGRRTDLKWCQRHALGAPMVRSIEIQVVSQIIKYLHICKNKTKKTPPSLVALISTKRQVEVSRLVNRDSVCSKAGGK